MNDEKPVSWKITTIKVVIQPVKRQQTTTIPDVLIIQQPVVDHVQL